MSLTCRRLKVLLSYDGHAYCGFQRQRPGLPTVQDVVFAAVEAVTGAPPMRFSAAGRTDAGVHARGQVIAFDTAGSVPVDRLVPALNANLPRDVAAVSAAEVPAGFHPGFDAVAKTYAYSLYGWDGLDRQPLLDRYSLYVPWRLDLPAMDDAASRLVGSHDCSAFQDAGRPVKNAVRRIDACTVRGGTHQLAPWAGLRVATVTVTAQGFLYHMVRIIAGTLVEVGRGKLQPSDVETALAERRRDAVGPTLPPYGLCLQQVHYCTPGDCSSIVKGEHKGQSSVDTPRPVS